MSDLLLPSANLLPYEGEVYYFENCFSQEEADGYMKFLRENVVWKQEPIKIFGREMMQPRLTALYGDPTIKYRYSGISMIAIPISPEIMQIKKRAEKVAGSTFTHVLLNYYRDRIA